MKAFISKVLMPLDYLHPLSFFLDTVRLEPLSCLLCEAHRYGMVQG